ncbi:hypothetical protein [Parafrankia discariae]|uniref:hypothetical protein n=1 Tax=Parafrankia discariae TaxID=365528 RepID=UPI0003792FB0|nr:hypothetical protein [Parafrankia discariae]
MSVRITTFSRDGGSSSCTPATDQGGLTTPTWFLICAVVCVCLCAAAGVGTIAVAERRAHAVSTIGGQTAARTQASWDIHRHLAEAAAAEAATFLGINATPDEPDYADFAAAMRAATEAMVRAGATTDPGFGDLACSGREPPATAGPSPATSSRPSPDSPDPANDSPASPSPADGGPGGSGPADGSPGGGGPGGGGPGGGGARPVPPPSGEAAAEALATLVCLTPVYTRYVGEARANDRLAMSVGGAYLRAANSLMNDRLLPASATLARSQTEEQAQAFRRATRAGDVVGLAVVASLALAALAAAQVLGLLRTRRLLNPGLLAAVLLVVVGIAWPQAALATERAKLASARSAGYDVQAMLARVRHLALRAEGDVLYWRIAQGGEIVFDADYDRAAAQLACAARGREPGTTPLSDPRARNGPGYPGDPGGQNAADGTDGSAGAHDAGGAGGAGTAREGPPGPHEALARDPDFVRWCGPATAHPLDPGTVELADLARRGGAIAIDAPADDSTRDSTGRFRDLANTLTRADGAAEARFGTEVAGAGDALRGVAAGAGALFLLAAVLVAFGLAPRIREYG